MPITNQRYLLQKYIKIHNFIVCIHEVQLNGRKVAFSYVCDLGNQLRPKMFCRHWALSKGSPRFLSVVDLHNFKRPFSSHSPSLRVSSAVARRRVTLSLPPFATHVPPFLRPLPRRFDVPSAVVRLLLTSRRCCSYCRRRYSCATRKRNNSKNSCSK